MSQTDDTSSTSACNVPIDVFECGLVDQNAERVNIGIFDRNAVFRHKRVTSKKAIALAKSGYPFCEVLYQWDTAEELYTDGLFIDRPAALDKTSLRPWPLVENEALCIADFTGEFGELSPRNQLKRQIARAAELGFTVHTAFEFEFTLFEETGHSIREKGFENLTPYAPANRTYSLRSAVENGAILDDFLTTIAHMGIDADALHTEMGPGCFEVPLKHASGVTSADNAALFKNVAKAFFAKRGLTACFMSKVLDHLPGQSGHLHLSLTELASGRPVFHDPQADDRLSKTARHFIGGVMKELPHWLALCSNTTNAFKRMQPGMWAPTFACWGVQNRTSALRAIPGKPEETRLEFRVPSADTNPHSALSLLLGAGLSGIENATEPPAARQDDCYASPIPPDSRFPRDLAEAADWLDQSQSARTIFGDTFVTGFAEACRVEDAAHRKHVSAWERQRYIEVV